MTTYTINEEQRQQLLDCLNGLFNHSAVAVWKYGGFHAPAKALEMLQSLTPNTQEPVAYVAWRDGKPCYEGEDAVCENAVWPVDGDDDRTSMAVYLHPASQAERTPLTDDEIRLMFQTLATWSGGKPRNVWEDIKACGIGGEK